MLDYKFWRINNLECFNRFVKIRYIVEGVYCNCKFNIIVVIFEKLISLLIIECIEVIVCFNFFYFGYVVFVDDN